MKKTKTIEVVLKNMQLNSEDDLVLSEYDKDGMIESSNTFEELFYDIDSDIKVSLGLNCDIECLGMLLESLKEKEITGINLSVKNVELSL